MSRHIIYIVLLVVNVILSSVTLYNTYFNKENSGTLTDNTELDNVIAIRQKVIDKKKTNLNKRYEGAKNIPIITDESELDTWFQSDSSSREFFK